MNNAISIGEPWMWAAINGAKMLMAPWSHAPVQTSLAIVVVLIGTSVAASLIATRKEFS